MAALNSCAFLRGSGDHGIFEYVSLKPKDQRYEKSALRTGNYGSGQWPGIRTSDSCSSAGSGTSTSRRSSTIGRSVDRSHGFDRPGTGNRCRRSVGQQHHHHPRDDHPPLIADCARRRAPDLKNRPVRLCAQGGFLLGRHCRPVLSIYPARRRSGRAGPEPPSRSSPFRRADRAGPSTAAYRPYSR